MILSCPLGSLSHEGWPHLPSLGLHSHPRQTLFPDPRQRACVALPDSLLVELLELRPVPFVKLLALTPPSCSAGRGFLFKLAALFRLPMRQPGQSRLLREPLTYICPAASQLLPSHSCSLPPQHSKTLLLCSSDSFTSRSFLPFSQSPPPAQLVFQPLCSIFSSRPPSLPPLSSLRQHSSEQPSTGIFETILTIRSKPVSISASVPN